MAESSIWHWMVQTGLIQGDPNWYLSEHPDADAYSHAVTVAFNATAPGSPQRQQLVDRLWSDYPNIFQGSKDYWYQQPQGGTAVNTDLRAASGRLKDVGGAAGGAATAGSVAAGAPGEEQQARAGVGGGTGTSADKNQLTILTGNKMKWYFDNTSGKWYVGYGLPNSDREMLFEAEPDQLDALFGQNVRPTGYTTTSLGTLTSTGRRTFAGNVAEMEGKGSFESEYSRVVAIALDSGRLPSWAQNNGEIEELLFISQAENKSNEWLVQQISTTQAFRDRFGNAVSALQKSANLSIEEAIGGFLEMEANLKRLEKQYGRDGSMVNAQTMEQIINKGYSMTEINQSYQIFARMRDNQDALTAFNEVLVAQGHQPMDSQGMYNFLAGRAPQDIYDIYEASSFREQAQRAGLGHLMSGAQAIDAALETLGVVDPDKIEAGFQNAAQLILRLRGDIDAGTYGLNQEDLLDMALGLAPRSGMDRAKLIEGVDAATKAANAYINTRRSAPYRNYQGGKPSAGSLAGSRVSG
jgi:hypothetical protein